MKLFRRRNKGPAGAAHGPANLPVGGSGLAPPFRYAMLSNRGRVRKGNEDSCGADPASGAFVVCDGMGGAAGGEVASRLAADAFLSGLRMDEAEEGLAPRRGTPDARLRRAIQESNDAVFRRSRARPELRGMGTTLVALLLEQSPGAAAPTLTLAHVGDSRCYLFRESRLHALTEDHSLVEEQVRSGHLTPAQAEAHPLRNIITRAVGSQPAVEAEVRHLQPRPDDLLLLASDGLTRELRDDDLLTLVLRAQASHAMRHREPGHRLPLGKLCQTLVDAANDRGGADNITVLLLQLGCPVPAPVRYAR